VSGLALGMGVTVRTAAGGMGASECPGVLNNGFFFVILPRIDVLSC